MRYLFTGGGTGGHVFPALAMAQYACESDSEAQVLFVGTRRGIESRVVEPRGFAIDYVEFSGFAGKSPLRKALVLAQLTRAVAQALAIVGKFAPQVVVGVGGYASLPVLVAAALKRIPVVLHEQNASAGLANRLAARWARRVCISWPQAQRDFPAGKVVLTGNPVRRELFTVPPWRGDRPQLLIFGGSQGARAINRALVAALPQLREEFPAMKIVHQCGRDHVAEVAVACNDMGYDNVEVTPFIDDMRSAYAASQLVVCRAGATSVAELAACGRPALLIPLPTAAADHQSSNAMALVAAGAARLLPQRQLSGEELARQIGALLRQPQLLATMGQNARRLSAKGAAELIIHECRLVARKQG